MEEFPTAMMVVAGLLQAPDGRILMQRRPAGKQHGGLWEFPGGKVEGGENACAALVRELNEELGIRVSAPACRGVDRAEGPAASGPGRIVIELYKIVSWLGVPVAEPGAAIAWFTLDEIADLAMPPLDLELVARLRERGG